MSQHHDPVVGDALRRLDVPEHGPDFWDRLDARLAGDDAGDTDRNHATPEGPDPDVIDLASSDAAQRRVAERRRTPVLALAAAVAVVVALVVGAAILQPGVEDESTVDIADVPGDTSIPDTEPPAPEQDGPATTVPTETPAPGAEAPGTTADEAEAAAAEWLDRLLAGDVEGAYARLDAVSQERMAFEEFEQMGAGLFEGAAAFAGEEIDRSVAQVDGPTGTISVVTFSGEVEREGMVETASYPVIVTASGVHFTLGSPRLELDPEYADASGTTLASPLQVLVAEEADAWVWFDGGDPGPLDGRGRVAIDVESATGPGTHLVNLLAVQGELITARAHTVVVP